MNHIWIQRIMRFAGCGALLALLAVSSYSAREQTHAPAVAVLMETVSNEALSARTMEETRVCLSQRREEALSLLESVLNDPAAGSDAKAQALAEKTKIASRMETEAAIQALLEHMGFEQTAVVIGEGQLSIIAPWQAAENEHNRVRMIDAAVGQSGFSADAVKIILSKK